MSDPFDPEALVRRFHEHVGAAVRDRPVLAIPPDVLKRAPMHPKEGAEVADAIRKGDPRHVAKECCDMIHAALGTLLALGVDFETAFREVNRSNLTKQPAKEPGGKAVKGPGYEKANLDVIVGVVDGDAELIAVEHRDYESVEHVVQFPAEETS